MQSPPLHGGAFMIGPANPDYFYSDGILRSPLQFVIISSEVR